MPASRQAVTAQRQIPFVLKAYSVLADALNDGVLVGRSHCMAGHVEVGRLAQQDLTIASFHPRLWLASGAVLCLLSSWYFALAIAPAGLGSSAPTVQQGLLPGWLGCREILHARNPYRSEVTSQAETYVYGKTLPPGTSENEHRFAYPVSFVFLFFPIAILPFEAAQVLMLAACVVLSALSVGWWATRPKLGPLDLFGVTILTFAAYPVVLGLQLRQPTLIIAALLALCAFCVRSGRLVCAGVLGGLSASKPHLAVAVLLPLLIWSVASWNARKRFFLSLGATVLALFAASELLVPGWVPDWLGTVRAYPHYAGARPLRAEMLGGHFVVTGTVVLLAVVVWLGFEFCDSDLLFAIAFSVAAFQLLFPFQIYNEILLLPAAVWSATNAAYIRERGQLHVLLFGCAWTVLGSGWAATMALAAWDIASPGAGVRLWQLPLLAAWLYPMVLFAALVAFASSSVWARRRTPPGRQVTA